MERVCEELDEAKAEIEKLRVDLKCKAELSQNLKKAHHEQMIQIQQANSKIEKQTEELNEKTEELSEVRQMCEDLRCSLNEKESIIRRLSSANDKLRVDCDEKNQKWEKKKRELVLALDEANERNTNQEQKINVLMAEIEGLKGLLSTSENKCKEVEKKVKACKERRERDDVLFKLEVENRMLEDQLKWKKEQFKHLEEAHEKLQVTLRESKKEWESEKSKLIDEICNLQTSLDSQIRVSGDLQNQLKTCNQALAHEESRKRYLEVEIGEFRARFENVFTECKEAKSQLEHLTTQRDKEIAALRNSLSTKETFYKEIQYQARKLEQENQDLLASLKEIQEAHIQQVGNSSVAKLRNKLRNVEQMHRDCSANLRAKEAEWSSQLEKLTGELDSYRSAVKSKEKAEELKMELEACHSAIMQLELQNEEASVMLLVLKSGIAEAHLNLRNVEIETALHEEERDENVSHLMRQLEVKNAALSKALEDNKEERQKAASLLKRVESSELVEEQQFLLEKELQRHKELLQESSKSQIHFRKQSLQTERELHEKIGELCDTLDMANSELATEREKTALLSSKAASLDIIEEKHQLMQKELEKYKDMFDESSRCQLHQQEQALLMETDFKEKLRKVSDALHKANAELCEEREKAASLLRRVESFNITEEQLHLVEKELERYKDMFEESSRCQIHQQEQALLMETDFKEKLRKVSDALHKANADLCEEREKAASLLRRVETFNLTEEQLHLMEKELERYKQMLEESSKSHLCSEKQALQKENDLQKKLQEVSDALDRVNSELTAKICEGHAAEFELWIWESIAQRLKYDLEENQALRKELEASLLSQVEIWEITKKEKDCLANMLEVKNSRIYNLQQQIELYEQELNARSARMETVVSFESEKESFLKRMREKDKSLADLQKEIDWLEQESLRRELEVAVLAQIGAERTFEHEKDNLTQLVQEKDHRIEELLRFASSLEQNLNCSLVTLSSELAEKQADISHVHEAWEKIAAAEILAQLEIEEKKLMIEELEDEIHSIQQKLDAQEISLASSQQQALEIEAGLEAKHAEMKKLMNQQESKLRTSQALVDELKKERNDLVEDVMNLSTEKKNLLGFIVGLGDRISEFSNEDVQLLGTLERVVQSIDEKGSGLAFKGNTELVKSVKEIVNPQQSPTTKRFQAVLEERLPFREMN